MTKKKTNDNLALWNRVEKTDPKYTKHVSYGSHKFTTIDAQFQLYMATEEWGPYGSTWGLRNFEYKNLTFLDGQMMAHVTCTFFYPDGEFPLSSSIFVNKLNSKTGLKIDEEWAKKVETDILTKALSKLGFNADVFMGKFDNNKYIEKMKKEFTKPKEKKKLTEATFKAMVDFIEKGDVAVVKRKLPNYKLTKEQKESLEKLIMVAEKVA